MRKGSSGSNTMNRSRDGLEISAIGSIYKGPWHKKYWSSSRGKDRYPYPIGYLAVRNFAGHVYNMEIQEGTNGPTFVITSEGGFSCRGETPTIAWDTVVKSKKMRLPRIHSRTDAAEVFGFTNPLVQRMFRELLANENGASEQNSVESQPRQQSGSGIQNMTSQVRVRKKRLKLDKKNPSIEVPSESAEHNSEVNQTSISENGNNSNQPSSGTDSPAAHRNWVPDTFDLSQDDLPFRKDHKNEEKNCGSHIRSKCKSTTLDRHSIRVPEVEKKKLESSYPENSNAQNVHQSSDHLSNSDVANGNNSLDQCRDLNKNKYSPQSQNSDSAINKISKISDKVISDNNCSSHLNGNKPYTQLSDENSEKPDSEKPDSDSMGQELAKSMMTFLLPQALPLLGKGLRKKRKIVKTEVRHANVQQDQALKLFCEPATECRGTVSRACNFPMLEIPNNLDAESNLVLGESIMDRSLGIKSQDLCAATDNKASNSTVLARTTYKFPSRSSAEKSWERSVTESAGLENNYVDTTLTATKAMTDVFSVGVENSTNVSVSENDNDGHVHLKPSNKECTNLKDRTDGLQLTTDAENSKMEHDTGQCSRVGMVQEQAEPAVNLLIKGSVSFPHDPMRKTSLVTNLESMKIVADNPKSEVCRVKNNKGTINHESLSAETVIPDSFEDQTLDPVKALNSSGRQVVHQFFALGYTINANLHEGKNSFTANVENLVNDSERSRGNAGKINISEDHVKGCQEYQNDAPSVKNQDQRASNNVVYKSNEEFTYMPDALAVSEAGVSSVYSTMKNQAGSCAISRISSTSHDLHVVARLDSENMLSDSTFKGMPFSHSCSESMGLPSLSNFDSTDYFTKSACLTMNQNDDLDSMQPTEEFINEAFVGVIEKDTNNMEASCHSENNSLLQSSDPSKILRTLELFELVGCYKQPLPVVSLLSNTRGNLFTLCVVCGLPNEYKRTLFVYKIVTENMSRTSYLHGFGEIILPEWKGLNSALDRCGIQLTPDGENLVLLDSIKVGDVGSVDEIKSRGVKLASVNDGYISVTAKLSVNANMYCVLVSAPELIVAAGENGQIHIWKMDLEWRKCVEEFSIPVRIAPATYIWELLAVPRTPHVVIGHDCNGDYLIWDISKRTLLSTFSGGSCKIMHSVIVNIYSKCQHNKIMDISRLCKSFNEINEVQTCEDLFCKECFISDELHIRGLTNATSIENIAVCMLVLSSTDTETIQDNNKEMHDSVNRASWRIALLANNTLLLGDSLDSRASIASALACYGILGTSEGNICAWEIIGGKVLFTLQDLKGLNISCISGDPTSSAFAVACCDGGVFLYMRGIVMK